MYLVEADYCVWVVQFSFPALCFKFAETKRRANWMRKSIENTCAHCVRTTDFSDNLKLQKGTH